MNKIPSTDDFVVTGIRTEHWGASLLQGYCFVLWNWIPWDWKKSNYILWDG